MFHLDPPFKTVGLDGIRLGRLPRWLNLLIKLAAILDSEVQSRLAQTPPPSQVEPAKTVNLPKIHLGYRTDSIYQVDMISVARSRPGGPRWTQVAFLEHPPSRAQPAKKSYRTCP